MRHLINIDSYVSSVDGLVSIVESLASHILLLHVLHLTSLLHLQDLVYGIVQWHHLPPELIYEGLLELPDEVLLEGEELGLHGVVMLDDALLYLRYTLGHQTPLLERAAEDQLEEALQKL